MFNCNWDLWGPIVACAEKGDLSGLLAFADELHLESEHLADTLRWMVRHWEKMDISISEYGPCSFVLPDPNSDESEHNQLYKTFIEAVSYMDIYRYQCADFFSPRPLRQEEEVLSD